MSNNISEKFEVMAHDYASSVLRHSIWVKSFKDYPKELNLPIIQWAISSNKGNIAYICKKNQWENGHKAFAERLKNN